MEILIAEDDPGARVQLAGLAQKLGHQVVVVGDGEAAVRAFAARRPDLVMIDGQIPQLDGYAATRRMRELATERWVPIMFVAGDADPQAVTRALEAGAEYYVVKPVNMAMLRAKLAVVERVHRLYQEGARQQQLLQSYRDAAEQEGRIAGHLLQKLVSAEQLADPLLDCLVVPVTNYSGDLVAAARTPNGVLHVMLADAVGHGLAAAINVLPIVPCFYAMTAKGFDLDMIAIELNRTLRQYMPVDRFVATTLIALDPVACRLKVWNGGNPEVLAFDPAGNIIRRFASKNLALGILAEAAFDPVVDVMDYSVACQVFACSDGVVEDYGVSDDGIERQQRIERMLEETPPSLRMKRMRSALAARTFDGNAQDDMTVVLLQCDPAAARPAPPRLFAQWQFKAAFDLRDLREFDVPGLLLDTIATVPGLRPHLRRLGPVVAELFADAVDHCLLRTAVPAGGGGRVAAVAGAARAAALAQLERGSIAAHLELRQDSGPAALVIALRGGADSTPAVPAPAGALTERLFASGNPLAGCGCSATSLGAARTHVDLGGGGCELRVVYALDAAVTAAVQAAA
jgi:CheY-like chemotaxis protein